MPCAMMHLVCAKLYDPNADIAFYIGNEAPDCMDIREIKDKSHFRIYTDDREQKLTEFAHTLDLSDPYELGVLLHLYVDMLWDRGPMAEHKRNYKGENWFHDYRRQIRLIGTHLYKSLDWSKSLWQEMSEADESRYASLEVFPAEKIKGYICFNRDRDRSSETTPSPDFPPELVDRFCIDAVESFKDYLNRIST
ncbi:MAG: hypothetical protein IJA55_10050 [Clostridia bacterium]|nr:hypothetical protein [Clostridia bacterium]